MLKITNEDAAFVLGKNGKTKEKIARVSGADLDLYEQSLTLEIRGSDAARGGPPRRPAPHAVPRSERPFLRCTGPGLGRRPSLLQP